jgi:hypothetical protein
MLAVFPFARTRTLNTLFRKFHFGVCVNQLMGTSTYFFHVRCEFAGKQTNASYRAAIATTHTKKYFIYLGAYNAERQIN